jgi:hypothetical protein
VGSKELESYLSFESLRDMLKGTHAGNVSVKWDGAPAIFAGIDPSDNQFFVAKKGIFNKNPKVYKSPADIDADTSGDLADKLKDGITLLARIGNQGRGSGRLSLRSRRFVHRHHKRRKVYYLSSKHYRLCVPAKSDAAKTIKSAKIGIVWHTTYKGNTFESMRASYGVDVSKFKKSKMFGHRMLCSVI